VSAVWRASRAAVRRRRLQTFVIGLVVLFSTATIVLGLALLVAARAPFDQAFGQQRGAHVVATFDAAEVSAAELAGTARRPGVRAAAGPFAQVVLQISHDWYGHSASPLVVVGRAAARGPVDHVELRFGRWATRPGEVVLGLSHRTTGAPSGLGQTLQADGVRPLTVVGYATSMSNSAGGWVTPAQAAAWHPTAWQMLYRFTAAGTDRQVSHHLTAATEGRPAAALVSAQSWLTLRQEFSGSARSLLPFLSVFGALGLAVSVLIVGNVVTGAVVSGYRHIGILKAIGFTSGQVVAVYLAMIGVPALTGGLVGALAGRALAGPTLQIAFSGIPVGTATIAPSEWAAPAGLLGMLALVAVTALVPALRAGRLAAARAISAGSAPRTGRGLRIQRALAGSRVPRALSLGLGQPFTRPGRTAMMLSAVTLGVATATLTTGLTGTVIALARANHGAGAPQVEVDLGDPPGGRVGPRLDDAGIETLLRSLPGARRLTARAFFQVSIVGYPDLIYANFYRGDPPDGQVDMVEGRRPTGPGEAAAGLAFLTLHGLKVGDQVTLAAGGHRRTVTIVGETADDNSRALDSTWPTLTALAPGTTPVEYRVTLAPGTSDRAYAAAVRAADPGLEPSVLAQGGALIATIVTFSVVFTALLVLVAALGVVNTVLLNIRERRRDLGVLKSIGMTPRQVVAMVLGSVAALGAGGGLLGVPLGIATHRLIVDHLGTLALPPAWKEVWSAPELVAMMLAGVLIAVLGAALPARAAARLPVAAVLHTE
jgi:putative ABC transport system permease protein